MVAVKLTVVVAFIALGAAFIKTGNWHPLIPANTGEFGHYGWSGILRGASVVFFAFIGFDAVSTAAQEARDPQKDMPRGILGALVICTMLYIAVAGVLTGLVPYHDLNVSDPIAKGVDVIGYTWFSVLIKIGALTGLTTVILVLLYGQSRIFYTMAHDGLLPGLFAKIHPRLQTPYLSQIMIGSIVALVAAFVPIAVLGEMVSIGTLLAFVLVCGAVIYLRRSDADVHRPFRVPGVPVVPLLGIAFCLVLMAGPAAADLGAPDRLAGDRFGDLLFLRPQAFGDARQGERGEDRRVGSRAARSIAARSLGSRGRRKERAA